MSTYRQRIHGLGRHHLAFAFANCVLNRRFAAATGCRRYDGKCSFYFNYFFRTTTTNWDLREKAVYLPPQFATQPTGTASGIDHLSSSACNFLSISIFEPVYVWNTNAVFSSFGSLHFSLILIKNIRHLHLWYLSWSKLINYIFCL